MQRAEADASVERTEPHGLRFYFLISSSKDSASRAGLTKHRAGTCGRGRPFPCRISRPSSLAAVPAVRCAAEANIRPMCGNKACSRRRPATLRGGLQERHALTPGAWLGAPRGHSAWAPTSRARGSLCLTPKVDWDKASLTRNVVICFVSALDHQSCVPPYKIAPHKEPGNGCILDLSQPPHRQLRRKLGASEPGLWARSGFPGGRPLGMGMAHWFAFLWPPTENSKRHPSGTH